MLQSIEVIGFGVGTTELLIILAIFVFIFGASRLPELGRSLGSGIRGFSKAVKGDDEKKLIEAGGENAANTPSAAASSAGDGTQSQPQRDESRRDNSSSSNTPT